MGFDDSCMHPAVMPCQTIFGGELVPPLCYCGLLLCKQSRQTDQHLRYVHSLDAARLHAYSNLIVCLQLTVLTCSMAVWMLHDGRLAQWVKDGADSSRDITCKAMSR